MKRFQRIALLFAHFKNIIFVWVGKPDLREGPVESRVKTGKLSFFQGNQWNCFNFALEG